MTKSALNKPWMRVLVDDFPLPMTFIGRVAWTLDRLIKAGDQGITSFENPAPRLSDYVFKLRKAGVDIETIDEGHKGIFAGVHGRYKLRSSIRIVKEYGVAS